MGLVFTKKTVDTSKLRTALEIGGGFGSFGEILLGARPDAFYVDVDIPPVATIATGYLEQVLGEDRVLGYERARDLERIDLAEIAAVHRAVVLCPWQPPQVEGGGDRRHTMWSFSVRKHSG
jgi:putative sugar O-methyltransferase